MIVSRAPVRITLGGGGTDLKSYYSRHGGFLIAGAINKYCSVVASKRFYDSIRLSYSQMEIVDQVSDIQHKIFRAALELLGLGKGLELHSVADVPANSGLGASSSFTVALLNALHTYKKENVSQKQLAEEACHIEIDICGEPIGKQDQYIAAYGGLTCLTFAQNGEVLVEPLRLRQDLLTQLENQLLLFHTGKERNAAEILAEQDTKCQEGEADMINNLHLVKEIGLQSRKCLETGNIDMLGELFHACWENKKKRSSKMTDPLIDECYETARKQGAIGGKLVGAGGGGFLMMYSHNGARPRVIEALQKRGLRWEPFHFEFSGARIVANLLKD